MYTLVVAVHDIVCVHLYVYTCCSVDLCYSVCLLGAQEDYVLCSYMYTLIVPVVHRYLSPLLVDFVYMCITRVQDMCECLFVPPVGRPFFP